MDVDITAINCTHSLTKIKTEDPDATDGSSSFGDTLSTKDNCSEASDTEFQSHFFGQDGMGLDCFETPFPGRKKKLTAHWKNFIRPLMWRSKWAELKIIELQKQARKYDRKLAAYEEKKKLSVINQQQSSPDFASKLSPYNSAARRKTPMAMIMTRRRRRRVEDVTGIKSYLSEHNLFSYHERHKSNLDGISMAEETNFPEKENLGEGEIMKRDDDDCRLLFPELEEESHDPLEQFMRKILNVKSHVQKLKSELVSVITGSGSKFSLPENLGILAEGDVHSSSEDMWDCHGKTHSKYDDMSDFVMGREEEVSRYSIVVPDIIESNVGKLSSVDVTMHELPQSGESREAIMDNGHIHSGLLVALEEESHNGKGEGGGGGGEEERQSSSSNSGSGSGSGSGLMKNWDNEEQQQGRTNAGGLGVGGDIPVWKGKRAKRKGGSAGWKNRLLLSPPST